MTDYLVYDVFTDTPFGGNPLAVIPDARGLDTALMQNITREFNFSETTFVLPPDDPAHTAKVRIFTPSAELPFAGHPTIGTGIALADMGQGPDMVFELGVGPIPVTAKDGAARFVTNTPLTKGAQPTTSEIADCLGLAPAAIRTDRHPPQMAGVGLTFCLTELTDTATLSRAVTSLAAFQHAADRYADRPNFGLFAYVRDGTRIHARMFAPTGGIPEDPATGSASAALTAYLADLDTAPIALDIAQGVDMGRPSRIVTKAAYADGAVTRVTVSGQARRVMEGRLTV
ncbi:MAG: PhzF family phenazine biosynthesis protein [Pseudomonadota bacterium]